MTTKFYPEVGTKLYLSQRTGDYYVDMVFYNKFLNLL